MKSNVEQLDILRDNILYGLAKNKETKASLSRKTGVTRTTIYKILDGKVARVQTSTVERIANFFGATCHIIQNESLEEYLSQEPVTSMYGNKNPIAVPILNEKDFIHKNERYISDMVLDCSLTYYFSDGNNIAAVRVEKNLSKFFTEGNLLIIDRSNRPEDSLDKLILRQGILITIPPNSPLLKDDILFGVILEERFNV
ncbi:helix-turn-helix domain-containing protein [Vibrio sagamiensis]|uniref:HTH cro/C1-type domain-containing protein n=1 Tax=Vibrio sagamiensis NBRC 104589 TaxID=1219064 RepID=A0A511QED9_9VIBR|nr:helix-turn-helix transcriptional regulator [Vibrio sagamiensis]PNQ54299.1 XRE family transcriptional regulator [Vibrio agarivorans]GEM75665.1 hypothetical protein VSA01S_17770 [Vibrio sagamiensis NBRC 104589]